MKKILVFCIIIFLLFICSLACAQTDCLPGKVFDFDPLLGTYKSIVRLESDDYITGGSNLNLSEGY